MNLSRLRVYLTKIETIDREHFACISALFALRSLISNNITDPNDVCIIIALLNLETELKNHFKNEEELLTNMDYPFSVYHKKEHLKILDNFYNVFTYDISSDYIFNKYHIDTFFDLFLDHIDKYDLYYVESYKKILKNGQCEIK